MFCYRLFQKQTLEEAWTNDPGTSQEAYASALYILRCSFVGSKGSEMSSSLTARNSVTIFIRCRRY
jgi:hypothetical protein